MAVFTVYFFNLFLMSCKWVSKTVNVFQKFPNIFQRTSKMFVIPHLDHGDIIQAYRNSWALDTRVGRWTLNAGLWTLDVGLWTLDSGRWTLDAGPWTLDSWPWTLDAGRWTLDVGLWMLDSGRWTLDVGLWLLDSGR